MTDAEQRQKVRERLARKLWFYHTGCVMSEDDWRYANNKTHEYYLIHADDILSDPSIRILSENQERPENPFSVSSEWKASFQIKKERIIKSDAFKQGQQSMSDFARFLKPEEVKK